MAQIFHAGHNSIARWSLPILLVLVTGSLVAWDALHKSPYVRYTKVPLNQPVAFSHKHHTNMGIDCRYCHTTVEDSGFANVPPTAICMNCHNQLFTESPILEPVRESWRSGNSLVWNRVTDLPDHVYFNHSIHVAKGIGCTTCHGPVGDMPLMWRDVPLFMNWCLDCHRNPEKFVRPKEEVFNAFYQPPPNQLELGKQLVEQYNIPKDNRLTDCWMCHR